MRKLAAKITRCSNSVCPIRNMCGRATSPEGDTIKKFESYITTNSGTLCEGFISNGVMK